MDEYYYITYFCETTSFKQVTSTVEKGSLVDWVERTFKHENETYHILYSAKITEAEYNRLYEGLV